MKPKTSIQLTLLFILFNSCSFKVTTSITKSYQPTDYKKDIVILQLDQEIPEGTETLGEVKIQDSGLSVNCGYDVAIDKAKTEARKVGGNAIKIIKHKKHDLLGSSCHRITATILKINDIESYVLDNANDEELLDVDYAILKVYREKNFTGSFLGYNLQLGDSVICRVKNNFKQTIHMKKDGLNTLWAKTESKAEIPINLKYGKTYYLRCGVKMGAFVGRPSLELVDSSTGKYEYESIKTK